MFRGDVSSYDVEHEMNNIINRNSSYFVEWIPNNIKSSICNIPNKNYNLSATMIGNNIAIETIFNKVGEQFRAMYKRKAFVFWYTGEGMNSGEFEEAEMNMNDLVSEY